MDLEAVSEVKTIDGMKQYLKAVAQSIQGVNPLSSSYFEGGKESNLLSGMHTLSQPRLIEIDEAVIQVCVCIRLCIVAHVFSPNVVVGSLHLSESKRVALC